MITSQINNKICKKFHEKTYSYRGIEMTTLDNIILDTHISRGTRYLNKIFFFLSA